MKEQITRLSKMLKSGYSLDQVKRECWQYCLSESIGSATLEAAIFMAMSMFAEIMARNLPVLDGSEMIGEETVDEYLDRLVKEASPSWQGVDPQQFLDELRGRNVGLEWKKGAPDMSGEYLLITRIGKTFMELYDEYNPDDEYWDIDEVLWHIGPIPPAPQNDKG